MSLTSYDHRIYCSCIIKLHIIAQFFSWAPAFQFFFFTKFLILKYFPVNFKFNYFVSPEMWKRQESNPTEQFTYPRLFEKEIDQKWKDSHLGCFSAGRFCPELGGMLKINRQTLGGWWMDRELPLVLPEEIERHPSCLPPVCYLKWRSWFSLSWSLVTVNFRDYR